MSANFNVRRVTQFLLEEAGISLLLDAWVNIFLIFFKYLEI